MKKRQILKIWNSTRRELIEAEEAHEARVMEVAWNVAVWLVKIAMTNPPEKCRPYHLKRSRWMHPLGLISSGQSLYYDCGKARFYSAISFSPASQIVVMTLLPGRYIEFLQSEEVRQFLLRKLPRLKERHHRHALSPSK